MDIKVQIAIYLAFGTVLQVSIAITELKTQVRKPINLLSVGFYLMSLSLIYKYY